MGDGVFVGPADRPDKYRLVRLEGSGGEAALWRAEVDLAGEPEPVAVKVLHPERADDIAAVSARWAEQAELLRFVTHPSVIGVREHFEGDRPHAARSQATLDPIGDVPPPDALYLVMNWVEGRSLRDWLLIHEGRAGTVAALGLLDQIADALDMLHHGRATPSGRAITHGDLSPGNVMITDEDRAVLVDFGLVHMAAHHTRGAAGTPGFTAPEVWSHGRFSPAADRYGFAALGYFVLHGTPAPTEHDELARRLFDHPFLAHTAPGQAERILRGFSADPAERPSARDWLHAVRGGASSTARALEVRTSPGADAAATPGPPEGGPVTGPVSGSRRRRVLLRALAAAVAVVVLVVAVVFVASRESPAPTAAAVPPAAPAAAATAFSRLLGATPRDGGGVIVTPDGRQAFVSDKVNREVLVLDLAADRVIDRVPARRGADDLVLSPDSRTIVVSSDGFQNQTGGGVTLIDVATRENRTIELPGRPGAVVFGPDGRTLYVADYGGPAPTGRTVAVVDTVAGRAVGTIPLEARPEALALSPDARTLYVGCSEARTPTRGAVVAVPLGAGPTRTLPAPGLVRDLVVTPDGLLQVVVNDSPDPGLFALDPADGAIRARSDAAIRRPSSVAVVPGGRLLVVGQHSDDPVFDAVSFVRPASGGTATTAAVPAELRGVAVTPDGTRALSVGSVSVSVVDVPL